MTDNIPVKPLPPPFKKTYQYPINTIFQCTLRVNVFFQFPSYISVLWTHFLTSKDKATCLNYLTVMS